MNDSHGYICRLFDGAEQVGFEFIFGNGKESLKDIAEHAAEYIEELYHIESKGKVMRITGPILLVRNAEIQL